MLHCKLALKYLKGRNRLFFTFSNNLSLLGIIIGVFSLLVVSSVMNGLAEDMQQRVLDSKAEIQIYKADFSPIKNSLQIIESVKKDKEVVAAAAVNELELLLQNKRNVASTVCYGIDLQEHTAITNLKEKMRIGNPTPKTMENGIILGLDMSLSLNVTVGEYVQVISPVGKRATPFGFMPQSLKLKVVGIFISGLPEYDKVISYISLENSDLFSKTNGVSKIEVKTTDINTASRTASRLQKQLGTDYVVEDWSEFEANLFNAIKMEKTVMFIVLALMILLAAFNMSGNFIKLVAEKKTEIGVLKAMGASDRNIINVFISIGLFIGIIGTLVGLVLALVVILLQSNYQIIQIPISGLPMQNLPVSIRWLDFVLVPIITIFISFLATLNPAKRTTKVDPIKIIRDR
ncbi:MAG: ABC transporter permease [Candidatus Cloacimonadota bacterium]|nr:ABC transporter permease [Candidatus Cloacimonadota bacterium]